MLTKGWLDTCIRRQYHANDGAMYEKIIEKSVEGQDDDITKLRAENERLSQENSFLKNAIREIYSATEEALTPA